MKLETGDVFQDKWGAQFRVLSRSINPDTFAYVYQAEYECSRLSVTVDEANIVKLISRAPSVSAPETPARVLPLREYMAELATQQLNMFTSELSKYTEGYPYEIIDDWTRRVLNKAFGEDRVDHYMDMGDDPQIDKLVIPLRNHFLHRALSEWIYLHPEFAQMPETLKDLLGNNNEGNEGNG